MQSGIQKNQHRQQNFISGAVRYNLQGGCWKQMKIKSTQQTQQHFLNHSEQDYAIIKRSLYTFAPSSSNPAAPALYSFNFVNQQIKQWENDKESNMPELRKNYGLIQFEGRLCLFGGVYKDKFFNDLNSFCSYSNMWRPVLSQENTIVPPPRIPFVFTQNQTNNLFIFGGHNQNGALTDAYMLVDWKWKQVTFRNKESIENNFGYVQELTKIQGIQYCCGKYGIYFFGGRNGPYFNNQFYLMKMTEQSMVAQIEIIKTDTGRRPCRRAFHSMQKLGQASIAVYGGISQNSGLLRDFSVFDINKQTWTEVCPLNGPLTLLSMPNMYFEHHTIYIMGDSSEKNSLKKSLVELSFPQFEIIKSQICSNCIKRLEIKEKQQVNGPKKPFVSNGLIYNMAAQLKFPFQAVALLLDCAQVLKATQVQIKSEKTNNMLQYFDIRFNGDNLTRQHYSSIVSHSYLENPIVLEIIDKIKLGSMRLGKTLIYISVVNQHRRVFLFSADSLIISHYHELYAYFAYEERISDQWLSTQESIMHKRFIMNLLKSYFTNPSIIINSVTNHCLLILQSNVIMTNSKYYYGELIASATDITQCKNNKKVEFLEGIGFSLNEDPQMSLSQFVKTLYLNPNIKSITIQSNKIELQPSKYQLQLDQLESQLKIKSVFKDRLAIKQIQAECSLYQVVDPQAYIKEAKGILIYFKGRLINRFDCPFGDLFWQKFYKTKYKKSFGLWTHVGIINVLKGAQVKSLQNEFKNQGQFNFFMRYIKKEVIYKNRIAKPQTIQIQEEGKSNKAYKRQR